MKTYLTEFYHHDLPFCGQRINGINLEDAKRQAEPLGLNVIGEWVEDIDEETGDITPNPMYN